MDSVHETTCIRVSAFGADFSISRPMYEQTAWIANQIRRFCFVGILRDGGEVLSTDREDLLVRGCEQIAWIAPASQAVKL